MIGVSMDEYRRLRTLNDLPSNSRWTIRSCWLGAGSNDLNGLWITPAPDGVRHWPRRQDLREDMTV